jgi:hypothetical protein
LVVIGIFVDPGELQSSKPNDIAIINRVVTKDTFLLLKKVFLFFMIFGH